MASLLDPPDPDATDYSNPVSAALGDLYRKVTGYMNGKPEMAFRYADNPTGTETIQSVGMPAPTIYAPGRVGEFVNPATGELTMRGQARLADNPAMSFDTGGVGAGTVARAIPPAFRDWFGASKVATSEGMPLQVYHGTNSGFDAFDPTMAGHKTGNVTTPLGHFFTDQPAEASRYATAWNAEGGNVRPAYLSLQNPYEMSKSEFDKLSMSVFRGEKTEPEAMARSAILRRDLIDQGHDGIVIPGSGKGRPTEYVAFHPEQIAPATTVDAFPGGHGGTGLLGIRDKQ